jgi:hypothetical protein
MEKLEFEKEQELRILEEGLQSDFWKIYSAWLAQKGFTSIGAALSAKVEHREWEAGHASAYKRCLAQPVDRIREIKSFLMQRSKLNT